MSGGEVPVFKTYYRDRFREIFGAPPKPGDGLGKTDVRAALARANLVIPAALLDYYIVAGRHPVNRDHDRFRPIEGLEWMGDKLVFLEENQSWSTGRSPGPTLRNPTRSSGRASTAS